MKKTLIGLFAALSLAAGLMVVTTPPVTAAAAPCNSYSGCVDTRTKASAPKKVRKGRKVAVCGVVNAVASNARPSGDLRISVTRNRGKFNVSRTVPYEGGKMCIVTRKLKKTGKYTVRVAYLPPKGSIFNPSSGKTGFKVKRR